MTVKAKDGSGNETTQQYEVDSTGSTTSYAHDASGNLTSDGTKTYYWNALNQLVEVKEGSTIIATFDYDGEGRRTEKAAGGITHQYVYDAEDIVEERMSGSSSDTIRYYHGGGIDEPLARKNGSNVVTYNLSDHLGSVVQETSASGAVSLEREYDPWGVLSQGASTSGYGFTGREWDAEIALYYYRARYYRPSSGRFVSNDPLGFAAGTNFYAYVDSGPSQFVDPSGLCSSDPDQGAPPGGGSPSSRQRDCLKSMFDGASIDGIKLEEKKPSDKWAATTRKEKIIIYGTREDFFVSGNELTVLEEYYHVIEQWRTGRMNRLKWLWQSALHGYDGNKYEREAKGWAANNVSKYLECLTR